MSALEVAAFAVAMAVRAETGCTVYAAIAAARATRGADWDRQSAEDLASWTFEAINHWRAQVGQPLIEIRDW